MKTYEIDFGHHLLRYRFHYELTSRYMSPYIRESDSEGPFIISPFDYMERLKPFYSENQNNDYIEYKSLINLSSLELLKVNSVLIHAVAISYKDKAWLFTGKSGAGKTTQYKKWKIKFRDQVQLICGDMPCLETDENGNIHVYPTPWNGKERYRGKADAQLGGLIFLEQSDHNDISELSVQKSIIALFRQFAVEANSEEELCSLSKIADIIIRKYPVLKFYNTGDEEAVMLCNEYLERYL